MDTFRVIIALAMVALVIMIFLKPVHAQTIAPSNHAYRGHIEIKTIPSWMKELMKIKIHGGFRIEDVFRSPDNTHNIRVRSSLSLTQNTRAKLSVGGERAYGEMIYFLPHNKEWYVRQEQDDSTIGWRIRW